MNKENMNKIFAAIVVAWSLVGCLSEDSGSETGAPSANGEQNTENTQTEQIDTPPIQTSAKEETPAEVVDQTNSGNSKLIDHALVIAPDILLNESISFEVFIATGDTVAAVCAMVAPEIRQCEGVEATDDPNMLRDLKSGMEYLFAPVVIWGEVNESEMDVETATKDGSFLGTYTGMDGSYLVLKDIKQTGAYSVSVVEADLITPRWSFSINYNQENASYGVFGTMQDHTEELHYLVGVGTDRAMIQERENTTINHFFYP